MVLYPRKMPPLFSFVTHFHILLEVLRASLLSTSAAVAWGPEVQVTSSRAGAILF